ncbi:MAG: hypothetical protein FWF76_02040 [Oscillospiraceae bacterium]|nr:hypothetical protein [Oscillospiraceae bacterium]
MVRLRRSRKLRGLISVFVAVVMIVQMVGSMSLPSEATTTQSFNVNRTINRNSQHTYSAQMDMRAGDTVTVNITFPTLLSASFGIVQPNGVFRFVTRNGSVNHTFTANQNGIHRFRIVNNCNLNSITFRGSWMLTRGTWRTHTNHVPNISHLLWAPDIGARSILVNFRITELSSTHGNNTTFSRRTQAFWGTSSLAWYQANHVWSVSNISHVNQAGSTVNAFSMANEAAVWSSGMTFTVNRGNNSVVTYNRNNTHRSRFSVAVAMPGSNTFRRTHEVELR